MTKTIAAVALGLLTLVATGASRAADLSPPPRPMYTKAPLYSPAPVFTWQGLYAGINGGYGWASSTLSGPGGSNDITPAGALAGVQLGYNMQSGPFVYGLEGDIDYSWLKKSADLVAPCPGCELRNHYLATLRGRLGYSFGQWMPYITGGAAIGDIQFYTPGGGAQAIDKVGWTLGGGIEFALTHNVSVKAEYLYSDYGSGNLFNGTIDSIHPGLSLSTLRAGVNYHF